MELGGFEPPASWVRSVSRWGTQGRNDISSESRGLTGVAIAAVPRLYSPRTHHGVFRVGMADRQTTWIDSWVPEARLMQPEQPTVAHVPAERREGHALTRVQRRAPGMDAPLLRPPCDIATRRAAA